MSDFKNMTTEQRKKFLERLAQDGHCKESCEAAGLTAACLKECPVYHTDCVYSSAQERALTLLAADAKAEAAGGGWTVVAAVAGLIGYFLGRGSR